MGYSQNSEDDIIYNYFYGERRPGFAGFSGRLLSLGENDGKTFSNALRLIEKGWIGCLVEPSPQAFKRLQELHKDSPGVYCIQKAIGTVNGRVTLHESGSHLNQGDISLVSSIKESELARWKDEKFTPVEVDCITFDQFIKYSVIKKFEFISIDCEGVDLEILEQMNLAELCCQCIIVEWNGKDEDKYDALITRYGLKQIHKNNENLIYAL